jgi:hypothetical protein
MGKQIGALQVFFRILGKKIDSKDALLRMTSLESIRNKKSGLSSRQPNLLLNLKSNTMKNTVQK